MRRVFLLVAFLFSFSLAAAENDNRVRFVAQDLAPKFMEGDPTRGLCGEIIEALIGELAALGIAADRPKAQLPVRRAFQTVENGDADVFCGAGGRGTDREKRFYFSSRPVYQVTTFFVQHGEDPVIINTADSLVEAGGAAITMMGTITAECLQRVEGLDVHTGDWTVDQALDLIAGKRLGRAFVYYDLAILSAMNSGKRDLKLTPSRHGPVPQWLLYSRRTSPKVRKALDQALENLEQSGRLAEIRSRYLWSAETTAGEANVPAVCATIH